MSLKSRLKQIEWLNSLYAKAYGLVYRNYAPLQRAYMVQEYKNKYYYSAPSSLKTGSSSTNKVAIFNLAAHNDFYGLADRIKGAILTYSVCKKINVNFKINFVAPFHLNLFLEPNDYDWLIDESEVSYNSNDSDIIVDSSNYSYTHIKKRILRSRKSQVHIYSNFAIKDKSIYRNFHELFKPTQALQTELDKYLAQFGSNYINATFRFQNSLGDFVEFFEIKPLAPSEQKSLIERCTTQLLKLHSSYPDKKILVTSDSITFLEHINAFDFTYIIDGRPIHMSKTDDDSFDMHKKAFIDLFMISYAEEIFLFHTDNMYNSGFPRLASWINGVPFTTVKF